MQTQIETIRLNFNLIFVFLPKRREFQRAFQLNFSMIELPTTQNSLPIPRSKNHKSSKIHNFAIFHFFSFVHKHWTQSSSRSQHVRFSCVLNNVLGIQRKMIIIMNFKIWIVKVFGLIWYFIWILYKSFEILFFFWNCWVNQEKNFKKWERDGF